MWVRERGVTKGIRSSGWLRLWTRRYGLIWRHLNEIPVSGFPESHRTPGSRQVTSGTPGSLIHPDIWVLGVTRNFRFPDLLGRSGSRSQHCVLKITRNSEKPPGTLGSRSHCDFVFPAWTRKPGSQIQPELRGIILNSSLSETHGPPCSRVPRVPWVTGTPVSRDHPEPVVPFDSGNTGWLCKPRDRMTPVARRSEGSGNSEMWVTPRTRNTGFQVTTGTRRFAWVRAGNRSSRWLPSYRRVNPGSPNHVKARATTVTRNSGLLESPGTPGTRSSGWLREHVVTTGNR